VRARVNDPDGASEPDHASAPVDVGPGEPADTTASSDATEDDRCVASNRPAVSCAGMPSVFASGERGAR
jgi:hypothetical protein